MDVSSLYTNIPHTEGIAATIAAYEKSKSTTPISDPFRQFVHCRRKREQRIRHYYEEKTRLGCLAELKDVHIVSGFTDGVPEEIVRRFAGMSLATPAKWLAAALQAEDCPERCFPTLVEAAARATGASSYATMDCRIDAHPAQ
ncbi:hypothetical protein HPB52_013667 [Rhipicephalus sanguineus]|uniref:Uncharacterized protein n=1 Tax=Rhipicephalus sanguineus TaxID=34632 RepID=A0A9D4PJF6_RHISA|nr:hypothetical protein HPB52_013667 [Rhipicephalus sanguineus]